MQKSTMQKYFCTKVKPFRKAGRTHDELKETLKHFNETKLVGFEKGF